jgi:hypothetical protein
MLLSTNLAILTHPLIFELNLSNTNSVINLATSFPIPLSLFKILTAISTRNTVESTAINLLHKEGKSLKAGELLGYVITDFYQRSSTTRAVPIELIDMQNSTTYDIRRYIELLAEVCNSVTEPFGDSLQFLPTIHSIYGHTKSLK